MNELRAQQDGQTYWMHISGDVQPGNDRTEEVIETRHGMLSRIIAENGFTQMTFRSSSLSFPIERATNDEFVMLKKDACQPRER